MDQTTDAHSSAVQKLGGTTPNWRFRSFVEVVGLPTAAEILPFTRGKLAVMRGRAFCAMQKSDSQILH